MAHETREVSAAVRDEWNRLGLHRGPPDGEPRRFSAPFGSETALERDESDHGRKMEILLVDDNPGDVRLLKEAFRDVRLVESIHVATDGREAIDFVRRRGEFGDAPRPDLVFLDWQLPPVDGDAVSSKIGAQPRLEATPIVALTGFETDERFLEASDTCVDAYLSKPVGPDGFVALVRSVEYFWRTSSATYLPTGDGETVNDA